jgi:hypothetical protein
MSFVLNEEGMEIGEANDFLLRLVTMDETWLYHYDPETKQQSIE